jgi:hypothetical protein
MSITLTFAWWAVPTAITVLALAWAWLWPSRYDAHLGGIDVLINSVWALLFSLCAWIIVGILK